MHIYTRLELGLIQVHQVYINKIVQCGRDQRIRIRLRPRLVSALKLVIP